MKGVVYPPASDLRRYVDANVLTHETVASAMMRSFKMHADRIALKSSSGDMSYGTLDERTDRAAAALIRLGLKPLDRVLFQMANSSELLVAILACLKAGLIPVCTLASHREAELGYLADHAQARALLIDADDSKFDRVAFGLKLKQSHPSLTWLVAGRGISNRDACLNLEELIAAEDASLARQAVETWVAQLDPFQVAVFQLSGGTTGVPKIIPRMQSEYLYNMRSVHAWTERCQDEVVFCAGPLIHNAGMACHWGPALLNGASVITDRDLSVEGLRRTFLHFKPTWAFLMRPVLVRLLEALKDADFDATHVKGIVSSSHAQFVRSELGMPGYHFFGMAEGLIMATRERDDPRAIEQSIGLPVSELDEVRLYRPGTEVSVQPGEVGELVCRGPYTLRGYFDAPDRNREAFTRDGFYRSGDLVSMKQFGERRYYVFEGRLKDVINRGGEKVNCDEVERALRDFPGLIDVAIVAMPDDTYIERGCAFVCMEPACPAPTVSLLGKHLANKGLAKYKWPERVEQLNGMPVTPAGKVSKPTLREIIATMIASEKLTPDVPEKSSAEAPLRLSGVHHTARPTWKLQQTVEFYRDILGLPLVHVISARGWGREGHPDFLHFFFDSGNASTIAFFFYIGTECPEYLTPRTEEFLYRATHTAWQVNTQEELLRWKERIEGRGVEVSTVTRHEVIESIYFADPNGYPIEITVQLRRFNAKDTRDATLTMQAALLEQAEAEATGGAITDIDTVWRRKARLLTESGEA